MKTDSYLKALEGNMQEHRSKIIESASNKGNVDKILDKISEHLEDLKNNIQKAEKERVPPYSLKKFKESGKKLKKLGKKLCLKERSGPLPDIEGTSNQK